MTPAKGATKPRPHPRIALPEAHHVHDAVAAELGIDPDRLRGEAADLAAAGLAPIVFRELVTS